MADCEWLFCVEGEEDGDDEKEDEDDEDDAEVNETVVSRSGVPPCEIAYGMGIVCCRTG